MLRALLVALHDWADRGVPPPASNYPSLQDKTLISFEEARAAFPAIPGARFPTRPNELSLQNFGPGFKSTGGRLTQAPPTFGGKYRLLVPKADSDGLDIPGIRPVEVAAPTTTLTGWNVRASGRRPTDLCGNSGSTFPFPKTKAERQVTNDPRRSLEERYGNQAGFVRAVEDVTRRLANERFLLQKDADRCIQAAAETGESQRTQAR